VVIGIILVVSGILIAIYPPLLSLIVAFVLILGGAFLMYLGNYYKKSSRKFDSQFINFFLHL